MTTVTDRKKRVPLIKRLLDHVERTHERREDQRHPMSVTVQVQPLNADLKADGPSFRAITRDVSAGGIGFVHTEALESPFVRLRIAERDDEEMIGEVRHCSPVGELGLLYLVGVAVRDT